ncbi:hypothetical protein BH23PAT1_BH23PAT1_5290 [soil metagenome]
MQERQQKKRGLWIIAALAVVTVIAAFVFNQSANKEDNINGLVPAGSFSHAHGIAVDVENMSKLYIATHHGLFMLENDEDLYRVGSSQDDFMGFSAHPTNPKIFFASGHPPRGGNLGFQKSEDGGHTWQKASNGLRGPVDFHAMAVGQVDPDLIYGYYSGLQRSQDGGVTWEMLDVDLPDIIYLATDTEEKDTVYAATAGGLYASTDQGESWTMIESLSDSVVMTAAIKPDDNRELIVSTETRGLVRSKDKGQTWQTVEDILSDVPILYLAFARTEPNTIYAVNQNNVIFKSTDSGQKWSKVFND